MKKFLLAFTLLAGAAGVQAANLCNPVITSETVENGKVTIQWTFDNKDGDATHFQVTVFKMHRATAAEEFVLAQSDFDYIESTGTMSKHEYRGTQWDQVAENPGWWVKSPVYMPGAMGTDAFHNFVGSDNDDVFSGSYMISPDYDMTNVTDKSFYINAHLGNEAMSVTGGFAIWAWNSNWYDEKNINYKPIGILDYQYDTLFNTTWTEVSETCTFPVAEDYADPDVIDEINGMDLTRTRIHFYGRGYSCYWVNDFKVSVKLQPGDMIDYGASEHRVEGNSFVIDTTGDTENDYVYAYDVRAVMEEYDDYRELTTIRATNYPYNTPKNKIKRMAGVDSNLAAGSNAVITAANGNITVTGAETAQVFSTTGVCVYDGRTNSPINVGNGVFIVKAGNKIAKVVL